MTITPKIYNFPTFPIQQQVFHVPGAAVEGAYTSGGARIISPEPGGFGVLQIQPSLQVDEFNYPLSSWLMSKVNGAILRVRLAPTPQICGAELIRANGNDGPLFDGDLLWSNLEPWAGDHVALFAANALEGTTTVQIDMSELGQILRIGHVIGHSTSCYLIDEIEYDASNIATVVVTPPLRSNVVANDIVIFRPFFTGMIANPSEIIQTYDAQNNGHIQLPKLVLHEVII